MPSIEIDGLQVAYQKKGKGSPLVFLHSIFTDSRIWQHQVDFFADSFTVVTWDAPGCGQSNDPPNTWEMADFTHALGSLLDSLSVRDAHIVGAAWGSTLGLELSRQRPDLVRSLILTSAYAGWKGSLTAEEITRRLDRLRRDIDQVPETFIGSWIPTFVTPGASKETIDAIVSMMRELHPQGVRTMAAALADCDHRAYLPSIDVPVLVVNGEGDRRAPLAVANALRDAIPGARMEVLAGAGHLPYLERSAAFNAAVAKFLHGIAIPG